MHFFKKMLFGNPNTRRASSLLTKSISLTSEPSSQTPQGLQHWIENKNPHGWRIHGLILTWPKEWGNWRAPTKKRGRFFFCWGTTTPTCENHCLLEFQLLLHPKTCHACSVCVCERVCVCMCLCVSLSEALPLLTSCLHVFCDKKFVGSRRKAVRGVERWTGGEMKDGSAPQLQELKEWLQPKRFYLSQHPTTTTTQHQPHI